MKSILTALFTLSVVVFMLLGIVIVAVQLVGVVTLNGALALGITGALKLWAIRASVVTAFVSFIMSYLDKGKKSA